MTSICNNSQNPWPYIYKPVSAVQFLGVSEMSWGLRLGSSSLDVGSCYLGVCCGGIKARCYERLGSRLWVHRKERIYNKKKATRRHS